MKPANASAIRAKYLDAFMDFAQTSEMQEDCGKIASNTFNFPVVADDGEEGWVEVVIKVPKGTKDEEYDGYGRREEYQIAAVDRAEKKAEAEKKKAAKIAKDEARRAKAKEKAE